MFARQWHFSVRTFRLNKAEIGQASCEIEALGQKTCHFAKSAKPRYSLYSWNSAQVRQFRLSPLHRGCEAAKAGKRGFHQIGTSKAQLVPSLDRDGPRLDPREFSDQGSSDAQRPSSNPALSFPCLDAQDSRQESLRIERRQQHEQDRMQSRKQRDNNGSLHHSGPEPSYTSGIHQTWHSHTPLALDWGGVLPEYNIAYETWGTLNPTRDNAILLHTGLSASSHAHSTKANPRPGWWEKFIGSGKPLDTDRFFIICTNVIGGCYGSTGPGSIDPADGKHYATRFPIVTIEDMVRAQFRLLDAFGIERLYASVGCSMGGMQSLAAGVIFPDRIGRIVTVSGCARSHPYSIAMRHTQRQVLMMDPNWQRGFYYNGIPPHAGMKLAREIATVTYRSGPEWEHRFGRRRAHPERRPALCPDFLIETYLDHAGDKFCLEYDANSLLYVSKAMDLFDLGYAHQHDTKKRRDAMDHKSRAASPTTTSSSDIIFHDSPLPSPPTSTPSSSTSSSQNPRSVDREWPQDDSFRHDPHVDLTHGLSRLCKHRVLVLGVASDILFPVWQQREIATTLRAAGNDENVSYVELGEDISLYGHDTFLLNLEHVGGNIGRFLAEQKK